MTVEKGIALLNKIVGFVTIATVLGGAYYFYKTNFWRPTITVSGVDYDNGVASLTINGKQVQLYKNQILSAGGDFGVRFNGDTPDKVNRIELYRNFLTYSVIDKKS